MIKVTFKYFIQKFRSQFGDVRDDIPGRRRYTRRLHYCVRVITLACGVFYSECQVQ